MKERDLQISIRDAINLTSTFRAFIMDVKPVWNSEKKCWMKTQADSGMPDIYVQNNGGWGFWIEVKTEKGILSRNQKTKINQIEEAGGVVQVCKSVLTALRFCRVCKSIPVWQEDDPKLEAMLEQLEHGASK